MNINDPKGIESSIEIERTGKIGYGKKNLKKTFSSKSDKNLLPAVSKEINGVWTLKIADQAEKDEGSLDSWGLCIIYESDPESL